MYNDKQSNLEYKSNKEDNQTLKLKHDIEKLHEKIREISLIDKRSVQQDIIELSRKLDSIILKYNSKDIWDLFFIYYILKYEMSHRFHLLYLQQRYDKINQCLFQKYQYVYKDNIMNISLTLKTYMTKYLGTRGVASPNKK